MNKPRIFVAGGHYTPAKAVIDELLRDSNLEIYYVGRRYSLEGDKALSLEYQEMSHHPNVKFLEITTGRPQRKFTSRTIPALLKIPMGLIQSLFYLLSYRPNMVLSFGGHIAVPICTWAWLFGIPIIHHEQISAFDYPSKYLSLLADKVLVSFPGLLDNKPASKWIYTGDPLRPEIFNRKFSSDLGQIKKIKENLKLPAIYLTGGNQGSHFLNKLILPIVPKLLDRAVLIWQTGDSQEFRDFAKIMELIDSLPKTKQDRIVVHKFFSSDEIGGVYSLADVVIARSGANTVFEIAALGLPAIFIPIPWVHHQEQQKNAEAVAAFGGAIVLSQDKIGPSDLLASVSKIIEDLKGYTVRAHQATSLVNKKAAAEIAAIVREGIT